MLVVFSAQLAIASVDDCGEDERSVEQHIATMQQQMGKAHCDFSVVGDRMIRTYSHRRDVITSGSKLSEVLEMYPALKDQAQVCDTSLTFAYLCRCASNSNT